MALTASPNLASTNTSPHNPSPNLAIQNTIDAHATRILRLSSPPEVCVDASLGPYVTSIFRGYLFSGDCDPSSLSLLNDVNELEQLMELLVEHCNMTRGAAMEALTNIYNSVRTGQIDDGFGRRGRSRSMSVGRLSFDGNGMAEELGSMLSSSLPQMGSYFPDSMKLDPESELENSDENSSSSTTCPDSCQKSPFKATTLIPADLLGVLDDPSTPAITNRSRSRLFPADSIAVAADPGDIDSSSIIRKVSLDQTSSSPTPPTPPSPPITAKDLAASLFHPSRSRSNSTTAKDLAASLFHPSRSRSNSTTSQNHSSSGHNSIPSSTSPTTSNPNLNYTNPLIQSSASLLLTLNTSLSPSAASLASQLSNGDVNVAQFLIEKAQNAPPVCRHMLNGGCYRSDCQFNHDVEGHTCLFWLRGRCVKGEKQCRFLHGFGESMLKECLNSAGATKGGYNLTPGAIETGNLVQHNSNCMMNMTSLRNQGLSNASAFGFVNRGNITAHSNNMVFGSSLSKGLFYMNPLPTPHHTNDNDNLSPTPPSSSPASNTSHHKTNSPATLEKRQDDTTPTPTPTPTTKSFSFASVASKGYSKSSFTKPTTPTSSNNKDHISPSNTSTSRTHRPVTTPTSFVKIPQDLWNSSLQRNSSLFHIHDPLERYYEVSLSLKHRRRNVIDLHYQSLKTFQQVLNTGILDEKLRECGDEGVWIVTGSGHHIKDKSHQKRGSTGQQGDGGVVLGVLENAVLRWLRERGYCYTRGKDRNGFGGAVLVKVKGERL